MIRKILVWILIVTLNWNGFAWAAGPPPPQTDTPLTYKQALGRLDRFMELIEELRSHIDRSQFDLEALLDKLDYDADKIIKFVKEDIYFEQYLGLLRGARGTLMSRAGNSLDQALLLATLLKDAGYEARIVRVTLSTNQARELLSSLARPRNNEPPIGDAQNIKASLLRITSLSGLPETEVSSVLNEMFSEMTANQSLVELTDRETKFLVKLLWQDRPQRQASSQLEAELTREAEDYFYTEYQASSSSGWKSIHPALTGTQARSWTFAKKSYFANQVPPKLQHRFRFEVFLKQQIGDRVETHSLFAPWESPTANLVGVALTYFNAPNNLNDLREQPEASILESATIFAPLLNRNMPKGGKLFDINGNVIDAVAGSSPAAGIFQKISERFGQVAGTLAGSENPEKYVTLNDLWLQFTLVDPNGNEKVFKRSVMDPFLAILPKEAKEQALTRQNLVRLLTTEHTFMLATGRLPKAFIYDSLLRKLIHLRIPLQIALAKVHGEETPNFSEDAWREVDITWAGHSALFTTFDLPLPGDGMQQYRHEPSLVIHTKSMPVWDEIRETVDIVNNARRSISSQNGEWRISPEQLVRRGVWETVTEGTALPYSKLPVNALRVVEKARNQGIPIQKIRPERPEQVSRLSIPATAKTAMRNDLERGFTVITPDRLPKGVDTAGWWRVDMKSGQTLGMIGDGRGATATETITLKTVISGVLIAVLVTKLCETYIDAREKSKEDKFLSCLGLGIGAGMTSFSATLGVAIAAAILVLDIEVDVEWPALPPSPPPPKSCPANSICNPP